MLCLQMGGGHDMGGVGLIAWFYAPLGAIGLASPVGTLRWARFLNDEKSGKESPKAGPSPALWNPPRWYWVGTAYV